MAAKHTHGMPCNELSVVDNFLNLENNDLNAHIEFFKWKPIMQEWDSYSQLIVEVKSRQWCMFISGKILANTPLNWHASQWFKNFMHLSKSMRTKDHWVNLVVLSLLEERIF